MATDQGLMRVGAGAGFSLLEILIVVAVLGIAALTIVPTFLSHNDEQKIMLAANEIQNALRYAREMAVRDHRSKEVKFDTDNESLQVIDAVSSTPETDPSRKGDYRLDFPSNSLLAGVDIVSVGSVTGIITVTFLATGQPDAANTIVLSYGPHSRVVTVDEFTGRTWVQ